MLRLRSADLSSRTRIILVDDHAIVRRGVKALLEYEPDFDIIGEASDGAAGLELVERLRPDVVVTDLCMPVMSGVELLKELKQRKIPVKSIVLSMCSDMPYVTNALSAGASGYILKESGVEDLVVAIREAQAGRRYLSPPLVEIPL
jgi:DNA-binding NarL/FixJ family response regulator